jgi:hypothetical protein
MKLDVERKLQPIALLVFEFHLDKAARRAISLRAVGLSCFALAFAACEAASDRCSGERLAARALPPFDPPSFPRATAAGFLCSEVLGMRN